MQTRTLAASAAILVAAAGAHAQFVSSIDRPLFSQGPTTGFLFDAATGTSTQLFNADDYALPGSVAGFNGLAGDEANRRLLGLVRNGSSSDIYGLDYDTLTPTLLASTRYTNAAGASALISFDGLAYDSTRGFLYGTRTLGIGEAREGLWRIDLNTGESTLVLNYEAFVGGTSDFAIGGIDYDAATDTIYLADDDDTSGRGIWAVSGSDTSSMSFLAAFDSQLTDVDGLGAGGGKLFLLTDNADVNGGQHGVYDLATGTWDFFESPYPPRSGSFAGQPVNPSGGGAYAPGLIPAPGAGALLALGGLALARRKR
jgi:hypothetical protein